LRIIDSTALGEVLGEARGKVAGLKVLDDGKLKSHHREVASHSVQMLQRYSDVLASSNETKWYTSYREGNAIQMSLTEWQFGTVLALVDLRAGLHGITPMAVPV
jgi:hypothetical protein